MTQVVNSDSLTYLSHLSISFSICDTACLFNATLENKKYISFWQEATNTGNFVRLFVLVFNMFLSSSIYLSIDLTSHRYNYLSPRPTLVIFISTLLHLSLAVLVENFSVLRAMLEIRRWFFRRLATSSCTLIDR